MFSIFKQRTLAIYHYLTTRRPHLGAFIFISILFLTGYVLAGIYAANTGNLSILNPQFAMATDTAPAAAAEQATAAAPSSATDGVGILMGWVIKLLLAGASLMLRLAIFCLAFIIQIAGYNGYLTSTAVNVGWVMVRDITNMFFVVILLLVAFGTILGLEQYEWKKMLVKFFFAAVLVNFSRVICGAIIDVGQVVMITFVNGIAATAGGNLINAFSLDTVMSLSQNASATTITDTNELFTAALGSVVFSAMVLAMMMVFVFMLVSRLVVLWILIVLSPFAFVLSVIPQTQKYASQWWSEFGNHVVVGPAVVFFLWLSFAVVGGGDINTEIAGSSAVPETAKISGQDAAGIGGIMDWNKMSNFAIAIGILLVGAKTSQSLGTVGGSAMSKATDFGKKVAMVASGAGAAMWSVGKAKQGAVATGKWAAMNVPGIGGNAWVRRGKKIKAGVEGRLEKVGSWRNEGAKKLEEDTKKILQAEEAEKQRLGVRTLTDDQRKKARELSGVSEGGSVGRFFKRQLASVIETGSRADKKVKDREDTVEALKKIKESNFSTSGTAGGIEKQFQQARAAEEEKRGSEKKTEKMNSAQAGIVREGLKALKSAQEMSKNAVTDTEKEAAKAAIKKAESHVSVQIAMSKVKADISKSGYTAVSQDTSNYAQKGKFGDKAAEARLVEQASTNRGDAIKFRNDLNTLMAGGGNVEKFVDAFVEREELSHTTADARGELVSNYMTDHALHSTHDLSADHTQAALLTAADGHVMAGLNPAEQKEAARLGSVIKDAQGNIAASKSKVENDAQKKIIADAISKGIELSIRSISKTNPALASAYFKARKSRAENLQTTAQGRLDEQVANKVVWDQRGFRDLFETANGAAVGKVSARFKGIEREQLTSMFEASSKLIGAKWEGEKTQKGSYTEKAQLEDQIDALGLMSAIHSTGYADDMTVRLDGIVQSNMSTSNPAMNSFFANVQQQFKGMQTLNKSNFDPKSKIGSLVSSGQSTHDTLKIVMGSVASKLGTGIDQKGLMDLLQKGDDKDADVLKHINDLVANNGETRDSMRNLGLDTGQLMGVLKTLSKDISNRTKLNI